jgi:hypothetical protein
MVASVATLAYASDDFKELETPGKNAHLIGSSVPRSISGANPATTPSGADPIVNQAVATTTETRIGIVKKTGPTAFTLPVAAAVGNMTYHGGLVQHTQKIYTIFWSGPGASFPAGYQTTINQFVQDLNGSSYYAIASQYGDSTGPIATAVLFGGTWLDTTNAFPSSFLTSQDNATLLAEVNRAKSANGWTSDANTYFQIYTPSSVTTSDGYCGFHTYGSSTTFGVILYPVPGCTQSQPWPNGELVDGAIKVTSHEIMETATDPFIDAWFYQNVSGEIGDLCNSSFGSRDASGSNVVLNGHHYLIQQEWSNADSGCVMSYTVSGGSCGNTGAQNAPVRVASSHDDLTSAGIRHPPIGLGLPNDGVWKRTPREHGEAWTYTFNIGEKSSPSVAESGTRASRPAAVLPPSEPGTVSGQRDPAMEVPPASLLLQQRFPTDSDAKRPNLDEPMRLYEVKFDAATTSLPPELVSLSGGRPGWVPVKLDAHQIALVREVDLPYRCIRSSPLPGLSQVNTAISGMAGSAPIVVRLGSPMDLPGHNASENGLTVFDMDSPAVEPKQRVSSVRIHLSLTHRYLDEVAVWLAIGNRKVVLWDGWGGTDNGHFDDSSELGASITLDRVLTEDAIGPEPVGPWTIYISNSDDHYSGRLESLSMALTTAPRADATNQEKVHALATLDIVAQRAYLKTAASNGGTEVSQPSVGQVVYFYTDVSLTGSGSSVTVTDRALLDGSVFCSGSFAGSPGFSYWVACNSGWTATAGSHTLQWDLDYGNTVSETNESNNSASKTITPTGGVDIVAQRAYLKTAASNGGTEVSQPSVGQVVYFYADVSVTGSGSSVTVTDRALLDGSVFCSGSFSGSPGLSYWVGCNSGWTATTGSHTLQWDFDYGNTVSETNESNNSASKTISASGIDIVAQRAYLKTAASNGGTEVDPPAIGQTVYFYADVSLNGSGSSVTVTDRALLDGSVFCSGSFAGSPGLSYWVACNSGWTATTGTHTLQWDLDYGNAVTETNESNNSASKSITPAGGVDIVAQRAYLKTAASNGGIEVSQPSVGQAVYFYTDVSVTGSGSSVTVTDRALLDGLVFCSGSFSGSPGLSYWVGCNSGWTATTGTHTLQWDLDYGNTVSETNESNNSASKTITPTGGIDIVAQRAYLRTASGGGGSEVSQPTVGQPLYLHADYQVTGSGGAVAVTERALLDGNVLCACSNNATPGTSYIAWCSQAWTATSGSHTLQWDFDYSNSVSETNEGNNSTTKTFSTSDNPPTTSITAPSNGATVSGTVSINATASDDVAVTSLEIDIDGSTKSTTNSSSLTYSWNTTQVANGQHTIVSKASDGAGHTTTSSPVTVTVSNNVTCTSFGITPLGASPAGSAGSQQVTITGSPGGCTGGSWSASGNGSWLTVSPASGNGSGSTTVFWTQNGPAARSSTASIANNQFTVNQAGNVTTGFYVVTPCRLLDTRDAPGTYGGPAVNPGAARNVPATGACGIPAGATSVSINVTALGASSSGWVTLFPGPAGASLPAVSTINYDAGQVRANNAIVRVGADGTINIYNSGPFGIHVIIDVNGYFK